MRWDCLQCANILHFCSLKILLIVVWVVGFVLLLRLVAVCRISYTYVYYLLLLFICIFFSLSLTASLHTNDACDELGPCHKFNLCLRIKKKRSKINCIWFLFCFLILFITRFVPQFGLIMCGVQPLINYLLVLKNCTS